MSEFYIVKKNGSSFGCSKSSGAYEMYDCLGKFGVEIDVHIIDRDESGETKERVYTYTKIERRILKSGEIRYYFK